eukprot:SAG31_NODE_798_length_12027_cov_8.190057_8_plen_745_part_00
MLLPATVALATVAAAAAGTMMVELHVGGASCSVCTFGSIGAAIAQLRRFRSAQRSYTAERRKAAATAVASYRVVIHEGVYPALALDPALDGGGSGTHVEYIGASVLEPYRTEGPTVISAGVALPAAAWSKAPSPAFPPGTIQADLKRVGLAPATLGQLPENGNAQNMSNRHVTVYWGLRCEQQKHLKAQLFHAGHPGRLVPPHLARHPNIDEATGRWQFLFAVKGAAGQKRGAPMVGIIPGANDSERVLGWAAEPLPHLQGYWAQDWEDTMVRVNATGIDKSTGVPTLLWAAQSSPSAVVPQPRPNARYLGINLRTELDAPNEYYIDSTGMLYWMPLTPTATAGAVVSVNATALMMDGVSHTTVRGITISHSRSVGLSAKGVTDVHILNCTVAEHGGNGIELQGSNSSIVKATIFEVGCHGIKIACGNMRTLSPGNCTINGTWISAVALYKRSYSAAIQWSGVANTFSRNLIQNAPHNCVNGGGNIAEPDVGAVDNVFEANTFQSCAYETADVGAFYTCGGGATALVNPGNVLRSNMFRDIYNVAPRGVQQNEVSGVYLDDGMAGWEVTNNTFLNVSSGVGSAVFIGGGRLNVVANNTFVDCVQALHLDTRGLGHHKGPGPPPFGCTGPKGGGDCIPRNGYCDCQCGAVHYELAGPAGSEWGTRFPELVRSLTDLKCNNASWLGRGLSPCYTRLTGNKLCRSKFFVGPRNATLQEFGIDMSGNDPSACSTLGHLDSNDIHDHIV